MAALSWAAGLIGSFAVAIVILYLRSIAKSLEKIERRLELTVSKDACKENRDLICSKIKARENEDNELWKVVNKHSHEGLSPDARVVREE